MDAFIITTCALNFKTKELPPSPDLKEASILQCSVRKKSYTHFYMFFIHWMVVLLWISLTHLLRSLVLVTSI